MQPNYSYDQYLKEAEGRECVHKDECEKSSYNCICDNYFSKQDAFSEQKLMRKSDEWWV